MVYDATVQNYKITSSTINYNIFNSKRIKIGHISISEKKNQQELRCNFSRRRDEQRIGSFL